jgi:hypothetical protein
LAGNGSYAAGSFNNYNDQNFSNEISGNTGNTSNNNNNNNNRTNYGNTSNNNNNNNNRTNYGLIVNNNNNSTVTNNSSVNFNNNNNLNNSNPRWPHRGPGDLNYSPRPQGIGIGGNNFVFYNSSVNFNNNNNLNNPVFYNSSVNINNNNNLNNPLVHNYFAPSSATLNNYSVSHNVGSASVLASTHVAGGIDKSDIQAGGVGSSKRSSDHLDSNRENLPEPKRRKTIVIPFDCFNSNSGFNALVSSEENRTFNLNLKNAFDDS